MTADQASFHEPVLLDEALYYLDPHPGSVLVNATLGGGGHGARIAQAIAPGGTLIGIDRDAEAMRAAELKLRPFRANVNIITVSNSFGNLDVAAESKPELRGHGWDGVLFDLGVSSRQLDTDRGFSFRRDEPLDMRMDAATGTTAAQLLQSASESEIEHIIKDYGEERWAGPIARNIGELRRLGGRIETTGQLAELVERSIPRKFRPKDIHVATRTFQALRIAVNDELGQLRQGLAFAAELLNPGGRIVVISYHSLEDRIVKQTFNALSGRIPSAPGASPAAFLRPVETHPKFEVLSQETDHANSGRDRAKPTIAQRQAARGQTFAYRVGAHGMPNAQLKSQSTVFHSNAAAYAARSGSAAPAINTGLTRPLPTTRTSGSVQTSARKRPRVQTVWIGLILIVSTMTFAGGMAYLYGHALVTREGYRKAELRQDLRREREFAQQWKHREALIQTPGIIETKARELGMVPAADSSLVTIGEKSARM